MWREVRGVRNVLTPAMMRKLPEIILKEEAECWCYGKDGLALHIAVLAPGTDKEWRYEEDGRGPAAKPDDNFLVEIRDEWEDVLSTRYFKTFAEALAFADELLQKVL
jgi:hypothetical protein